MRIRNTLLNLKWILLLLLSCNQIENGNTLRQRDIDFRKSLKLLEDGETIFKFYSESKTKVAGNFFTDRRIAAYWKDERNSEKDEISFAFYSDIIKIDTVYNAGLTYSPYMLVIKKDKSQFKVSVNGKKEEVESFFKEALREWEQRRIKL